MEEDVETEDNDKDSGLEDSIQEDLPPWFPALDCDEDEDH